MYYNLSHKIIGSRKMSTILRSKYFWIAMIILIPFISIWIVYGLTWAIVTFALIGIITLFLLVEAKSSRRRRRYYYDDDDDEDVIIVKGSRRSRRPSHSDRVRDLYIPKVNKDFYIPKGPRIIDQDGLDNLRRKQERDLKRTLRRLRR